MRSSRSHQMAIASVCSVGIGAVAGLRPMMALAVVSYATRRNWMKPGHSPIVNILSHQVHKRIAEFALSEFIAEKLPRTRSRLSLASLGSAMASGAVCGAAIHGSMNRPVYEGAVLGALGAVAGAITSSTLREKLKQGTPDFHVSLVEDAFALGGSFIVSLTAMT
jgi:uncharacterized membrane protein